MPNYSYTAKSADGETTKGSMNATDMRELSRNLKNENLILVKAVSDRDKKKKLLSLNLSFGVPDTEKILMVKNLSVMVATGLSLVKSFNILIAQTKNAKLKEILSGVRDRVNKGENLSSAMASYPEVFSEFFLSMTKVGEESGTLEEVFKILSLQIEKEHKIRSKIKGAMVYPLIVLGLMLVVGAVIVEFVLPKLSQFFMNIGADIPVYTKALITFGEFSQERWYVLLLAPIVLIVLIWLSLKTKFGRRIKDTLFLRIPIVSSFVKKSNCAILIRSLSSLLGSGVPLTKSLEVASGTVGNFYFKKAVNQSAERIKKGEKLSETLSDYKDIFPFGAIEMVEVGEETGKTSDVLKTLADFYEDELIAATEKLTTALEPILIIVLGLMVGFFAISVIQPMYSSLQSII